MSIAVEEDPSGSAAAAAAGASHAYLGALEDVQHPHHTYFADGEMVLLPLIYLPDIVLFPGDELPLRFLSETSLDSIREQLSSEGALLAVLTANQESDAYGTTVRIEKFSVGERCATITGAARQRFRLKRVSRVNLGGDFASRAEVEILPQTQPPILPFRSSVPPSLGARRQRATPRRRGLARSRALECGAHWSRWVYDLFDARVLVGRVQTLLLSSVHCNWFSKLPVASATEPAAHVDAQYLTTPSDRQDPSVFAYWVAGNLPLSTSQRLGLLKMDSIVRLLRRELMILETLEEDVRCARCGELLATTREIFSMTAQGAAGTFVNPGGHVFQVLTLRDVRRDHVASSTSRSTEDSWFPGYSWSITHCLTCYSHLGWWFNRVDDSASLSPAVFYGFCRAALTLSNSRYDGVERAMDETTSDAESLSSSPSSQASPRSEDAPLLLTDVD